METAETAGLRRIVGIASNVRLGAGFGREQRHVHLHYTRTGGSILTISRTFAGSAGLSR
jgi:hypothetical protein